MVDSTHDFLNCVYEKRPATPSFKDGVYIQYVMEHAYKADTLKQWVEL